MKILCVLYDDPRGGMPSSYHQGTANLKNIYPDGMSLH